MKNKKIKDGLKFIDFLGSCKDYKGEIFAEHLEENRHSFSWNSDINITSYGKEQFKAILNSPIIIISNGNIQLMDKSILQKEYDLWMERVAGYINVSFYDKCFGDQR